MVLYIVVIHSILILLFCSIDSSIGNFLLAAAQSFFRSLPSAIFLFSSITNSQVCALSSS